MIFIIAFVVINCLLAGSMEGVKDGYIPLRHEYLNPEKVMQMRKLGNECCAHEVTCYFNLRWWVCPNPQDVDRSQNLRKQYSEGWYVEFKKFCLTSEQFRDKDNWNS